MLGKDLIKQMTIEDLDKELIVTENHIIRQVKVTKAKLANCKDGACKIEFGDSDGK